MFDIILLNTIFIAVPLLCFLLYSIYENTFEKKIDDLLFGFTIITSLYLITKYSIFLGYKIDIIKILLLLCMVKNKRILSVFIAIYISISLGLHYNYNIILFLLEYIIQLSLFFVFIKNQKYNIKMLVFLIIEILCNLSFGFDIQYTLVSNIVYIITAYFIINLLNRIEKVIDLYGTIREVEYEKNFRESLFKVTHEIKNPIAVCKGYLDMLDTNNQKQVNKYIPIIKEEINRTLTLMNDFLNLTKLKVEKNIIDITLLLEDIIDSMEPLLIDKNIHFISNISEEEIYMNADYDRLKQVFLNLIKNSIEAIEDDKIGIIKLEMKVKKNIEILLTDNGSGISKLILDKIGEPFVTTKEKGTGLGIKLSKEIIELHDGTIKFYSKEKEGTTIKIVLPKLK